MVGANRECLVTAEDMSADLLALIRAYTMAVERRVVVLMSGVQRSSVGRIFESWWVVVVNRFLSLD
jgi:hypothetical protein